MFTVKGKILMTVLTVVLMFALFILFYFPKRQERYLLENYNNEVENFVKTVSLGVKIALTEQNFEGVETAIDFVRHDDRLVFVSLIQIDTVQTAGDPGFRLEKTVFKTYPENIEVDPEAISNDHFIIKHASFSTPIMTGQIILSFSTDDIIKSKRQIRLTSIIASLVVFIIGLMIGYLLARNISKPVLALRDAANKVGEGDLTQSVKNQSRDEIGELGIAFNKMVRDLSIEAALERVRHEIANMRTKDDLLRITPLIWKELKTIGIPFFRCGVFIIEEEQQIIQSYLSSPDGTSLGVFNLHFKEDEIAGHLVENWEKETVYQEHWDKNKFIAWMNSMAKKGHIKNTSTYQGAATPPESLDLHFIPFKQGMLYVGNTYPLSAEVLHQVKSLAEAFSIAYSRYEDFKKLEDAKNQMEKTLGELRSTQSQLIQSEKMASLGELTAGIAHEIQNPLNFVNNFSELSIELIQEMNEELTKGNTKEVIEISTDLVQNLDKISHHGQRASSIVKAMLEHSRSGDREKILTDINSLADEYLRLAFHGLRAKDKSFNAEFNAILDENLPKIHVIPQDICRVFLNIINNAFYEVAKKAKEGIEGYSPSVTVSTKKLKNQVEIRIKDNGNGITPDVLDKIFQPFYTTKPTGQGTGLGLSLSYDIIIKGHSGELKIDTKVGEGTEFIILLPE